MTAHRERVVTTLGYTYRLRDDVLEIWTTGPNGEQFYSVLATVPMDLHVVRGLFGQALARDIERSIGDALPASGAASCQGAFFSGAEWALGKVRGL